MDKLRPNGHLSRREFGIYGGGLALATLFLAACGAKPTVATVPSVTNVPQVSADSSVITHPTPSSAEIPWPKDTVLLFNQPDQRIRSGTLELYQNNNSFEFDPFEVYVSPSAFQAYVKSLESEGVVKGDEVRFVYHFPGDPGGSELQCQNNQGSIVSLEMARAIYEHVYEPHFKGQDLNNSEISKKFLAEAQSQENLVLFHEGQHILHCREGWKGGAKAEEDATNAESVRAQKLQPVFFLKLKPGADLNGVIKYIEGLRK